MGRQQTTYAEVFIVGLNIAALHVELGKAQACHNGLGKFPAVNRHTVGLALYIVEKVTVVVFREVLLVL